MRLSLQPLRRPAGAGVLGLATCLALAASAETYFVGSAGLRNAESTRTALVCPTNHVAVGLAGVAGTSVDQLTLRCAALGADGALGAPAHGGSAPPLREVAGVDVGRHESVACPAGTYMQGLTVRASTQLDQVTRLLCGRPAAAGLSHPSLSLGGTGGRELDLNCDAGDPVTYVLVHHGLRIDEITVGCERPSPPKRAGSSPQE